MRGRSAPFASATAMFTLAALGCGGSEEGDSTRAAAGTPPIEHVDSTKLTGYHVPSSSMEPTLHCGPPGGGCEGEHPDRLVVEPLEGGPMRGDIVAFKVSRRAIAECGAAPDATWIKRVVVLPGETWAEQSGHIVVDGKSLDEPYVDRDRRDQETLPLRSAPPDGYVLLGDNRTASCDSRRWGYVRRAEIIGKVVKVYRED